VRLRCGPRSRGREDRLFDDPFAAAFVAASPPLFPDLSLLTDPEALADLAAGFLAEIAIRTRYYDEYLSTACSIGCRQVVILGAGLDTRAFRLDLPATVRVYELDLPDLFAFKEAVLADQGAPARCTRYVVPVDLRSGWAVRLADAGFDSTLPCAWLAEGLLAYLPHDDAQRLLATVGALSAPGSQLSFEYDTFADGSVLHATQETPGMQQLATMWEGGLHEQPVEWLRGHGWGVHMDDRPDVATRYGRLHPGCATGGFLTAVRQ
jgi:methyltransferase (TIGR00027 family)